MKIIHTSDWHLGRSLYGKKRYDEFSAFLNWLNKTIEDEKIEVLLVAGDIFDTNTPSNRAQELYYRFLCQASASCCRHIVIIAGNHDSPTFLNAPKELLRTLNVHVVGATTGQPSDEVIELKDEQGDIQAIVCAVPYLRDKDIRTIEPGETIDDKNTKLVEGLKEHYAKVCKIAEEKRDAYHHAQQKEIPLIAMGHLFTAGAKTIDGDGVRELYVGSLAHIDESIFPPSIDYLALGHLHVPQKVGGSQHIRYCGSPIPMGYGEAKQKKQVILLEFKTATPIISEIPVPCFQPLARIVGSIEVIKNTIKQLKQEDSNAWLEIEYTGSEIISNLRDLLEDSLVDTKMEVCRIKNKLIMDRILNAHQEHETLDDLNTEDVFERCLTSFEVPTDDRAELLTSYAEIIKAIQEDDQNAE